MSAEQCYRGRIVQVQGIDWYAKYTIRVPDNGLSWGQWLEGQGYHDREFEVGDEDGWPFLTIGDWVEVRGTHIERLPPIVCLPELVPWDDEDWQGSYYEQGPGAWHLRFADPPWLDAWMKEAQVGLVLTEALAADPALSGRWTNLMMCSCWESGCGSLFARVDYDAVADRVIWSSLSTATDHPGELGPALAIPAERLRALSAYADAHPPARPHPEPP